MTNRSDRRRRAKERRRAAVPSPTVSSPPAALPYPRSALLYFYGEREDNVDSCPVADAKTTAAARSRTGHLFRVSFHFAPPPEVSLMIAGFPDGAEKHGSPVVLAAHGDSVLFKMYFTEGQYQDGTTDHFVYNAGSPSSRPPTVSLLPPNYLTRDELEKFYRYSHRRLRGPVNRNLNDVATGFLRRGEDEFVVAELKMVGISKEEPEKKVAELLMFRSGEWTHHRPTMMVSDGSYVDVEELLSKWETRCVLPLQDGLLCWVDISRGLLFCNAFDEVPELRFMPLPDVPVHWNRNVSVTADGGAVKFVNIFLRCCCGRSGATMCDRSIHAYTIHTWILRIQDMASWEMDGIVDSTEIWAIDAYKGLPHVQLVCPFVSLDEPHIVCFLVSESNFVNEGDRTEWFIMLDLRSKALLSACCRSNNGGYGYGYGKNVIPSRISDYFNPCPGSNRSNGCSSSKTENHIDMVAPPVEESRGNNDISIQESRKAVVDAAMKASEVLEVFQEIPSYGFNHDDVLKAIRILSHDSGRRFKSLLELPKSMRKDWLFMEIKASEA
ncbi:hypothetical protein EJB05_29193, partial [Eragrostis curvula]